MGVAVVVLLGGLWASILVPAAVRARRESSPIHSVDLFERSLGMLAPKTSGGPANVPGRYVMVLERPARVARAGRSSSAVERRKAILLRLAGAVPFTGLLAILGGGLFRTLFLLSVVALLGYVGLLVQVNVRRMQATQKVRRLPVRQMAPVAHERDSRAVGHGRY
ncbi:MAG TPA: hypothetical protein VNU01_08705 [Egibacteraceae bacterium]|nr:hypothetical protein [Egibacteraceae bacterium]